MPVLNFIEHGGRVVRTVFSDPLTLLEIRQAIDFGAAYRSTAAQKVHTLVDTLACTNWPVGFLKLTTERVRLNHPRAGITVVVGAAAILPRVAEIFTRLTGAPLHVCSAIDEADKILLRALADEDETVPSRRALNRGESSDSAARR